MSVCCKILPYFRLSAHDQISAQDLYFTVRGGMVKLPPRRRKKSVITYLSSCRVCKPALNSAILAVPSCSHCSYSLHDRTIDQLTIFSHTALYRQTSKQTEQQDRKGAIMANTLRSAIIEVCGKTEDCQHPFYRKNFPTSTRTVRLIGRMRYIY